MVIATISGGLGNQLFQYAMALRLARYRNVELKLDLCNYRDGTDVRPGVLQVFVRRVGLFDLSISAPEATTAEIDRLKDPFAKKTTLARIVRRVRRVKPSFLLPATHVREKQYRFDRAMMDLPSDVYLDGFWQTEKYFADIAPIVRSEFAPKDPAISAYVAQYIARIRGRGPVVSIHVRRGDWAHGYEKFKDGKGADDPELAKYIAYWGKPLGVEYVAQAMKLLGPGYQFLVFSDTSKDIQWCRQNIKAEGFSPDQMHFSEGHSDIQDMALMSACDHHIIANSTFSWWAAWLNPNPAKRVITPKRWTPPEATFQMLTDDLIPRSWEMI